MARFLRDRIKAKGQAPGSLIFIGNQKMESVVIQLMQYDATTLTEEEISSVEEAHSKIQSGSVNWINIYGLHDLEVVKSIGQLFNIPPLMLEDIVDTGQQPKYEDGEDFDLFILKMLHQDDQSGRIVAEQVTLILGENYLLTLQERRGDVFAPVRERIRKNKGRVRLNDNDYLAYALMDTVVDNYSILIEGLGKNVEDIEDRIFKKRDNKVIEDIFNLKTELNYLRKLVRPARETIASLLKTENSYFQEKNYQYIRDLHELTVHCTDAIASYNSLVSDQLNVYNSIVGNSMNEVMKVLTIFATIFIPLTFFAGIYGMNFEHIPELKYKYSYPIFWSGIIVLALGLLYYFRRKKWL